MWIYNECKKLDGIPDAEGTFFRVGMKVLKATGAKPLDSLETEAKKYKIGGYAQVDNLSFEGLKSAIYQNGVILAGFRGSDEGWKTAYVRTPKTSEKQWGHAISLIGWNKNYLIGQNSWGKGWGENGLFYIPKDYLPMEAWAVLVDLPNDFVISEKPHFVFTRSLYPTMRGEDVKNLNITLKHFGCFPLILEPTDYYGTPTQLGVRQYQISKNSPYITGNFGPTTLKMMNQDLA